MVRIRLALVLAAMVGIALPGQGVSQEAAAIPGWGDPIDPDGDCTIRLQDEALVITVPGTPHVLRAFPDKRNAPRVLRQIEGNWTAQVKITGDFDTGQAPESAAPGPDAARSAGLLLWLDDLNFVRLARQTGPAPDGQGPHAPVVLEYWRDGRPQAVAPSGSEVPDLQGPSTWIRMTRHIDKIKAEVSPDGETWTEVGTLTVRLSSRLRLGPVVTNTSDRPLEVQFEALQIKHIPLYP